MKHLWTPMIPLAFLLVLSLSWPAAARPPFSDDDDSIYPRIVARVMALDPKGLAMIQAEDGTTYQVVAGTGWRVGDTVQCERSDREGGMPLWKRFDCRKS